MLHYVTKCHMSYAPVHKTSQDKIWFDTCAMNMKDKSPKSVVYFKRTFPSQWTTKPRSFISPSCFSPSASFFLSPFLFLHPSSTSLIIILWFYDFDAEADGKPTQCPERFWSASELAKNVLKSVSPTGLQSWTQSFVARKDISSDFSKNSCCWANISWKDLNLSLLQNLGSLR